MRCSAGSGRGYGHANTTYTRQTHTALPELTHTMESSAMTIVLILDRWVLSLPLSIDRDEEGG